MATVLTVLKSGGEFKPEHVQALQRQVLRWSPPGTDFACLSDVDIPGVRRIPLKYYWPGWWSKMELFRPDILGHFLYTDLDNVILGPLDDILAVKDACLNSGVRGTAWTALMSMPWEARGAIWATFMRAPRTLMQFYDLPEASPPFGDAAIISMQLGETAQRWEDRLPGQVVNISTMATPFGFRVPMPKPRIVLTHRPWRPWTLPIFRRLYE